MKNAFEILGATPDDNAERLRELFEEKQLFSDDDKEVEIAYSELTNLKKRIAHEIKYFSKEVFNGFEVVFDKANTKADQSYVISSIVRIGRWFDDGATKLLDIINEHREKSDFALTADNEIVDNAVTTLKDDTITSIKENLEKLEQKKLVSLFNALVTRLDYTSFFVDDLLVYYENLITESIDKQEKDCKSAFAIIEQNAKNYINYGEIDDSFVDKIAHFRKVLRAWDCLVQPLQVNCQNRGATHPRSARFVHELRNQVIQMFNDSQTDLSNIVSKAQYDYSAKQEFKDKILHAPKFIEYLIYVINILSDVFKEIDDMAERLKKDKQDFIKLKEQAEELNKKVNPVRSRMLALRPKQQLEPETSSSDYITPVRQSSTSTTRTTNYNTRRSSSWRGDGSPNVNQRVAVVLVIFMIISFVVLMAICNNTTSSSSAYECTVTFNKQGGYGGTSSVTAVYNENMPTATKPSKTGYVFMGYYSSTNGSGTQYYDKDMKSVKKYDYMYLDMTLYAFWKKEGFTTLTTKNFEDYFTLTSGCSVTTSSDYYTRTAHYSYSITPKSSFDYNKYSDNPESISLTIMVTFSTSASGYAMGSLSVNVVLYKSNGYSASGSKSGNCSGSYWSDKIYAIEGDIHI